MELELEPLNFPSDQERPCVIAGPCSAETEEQVMTTARQLAAKGCHMFRAGVWKPRTKPGGFEGNGEAALPWMKLHFARQSCGSLWLHRPEQGSVTRFFCIDPASPWCLWSFWYWSSFCCSKSWSQLWILWLVCKVSETKPAAQIAPFSIFLPSSCLPPECTFYFVTYIVT